MPHWDLGLCWNIGKVKTVSVGDALNISKECTYMEQFK